MYGPLKPTQSSPDSRVNSPRPPCSSTRTPASSSSWRWMPRTQEQGLYSPSARNWTGDSSPVPFSPVACLRLSRTTTWATGSYWPSSCCWRNGVTGWRGPDIPYWHGTNTKPNALSCQFGHDDSEKETVPILPPFCTVGALTWEIEEIVRRALPNDLGPGNGPAGRLYVPVAVRPRLIGWHHSARFATHPGASRTIASISRRY
ncbi:uncharacterized protein LOC124858597 [Girardinichthys multiradiatus]|uniref:uncharacterized protein LOC124858597 n=1 Tax=Girardinichthys multiradiatus TaxID=208333 RepID=UPI001FABF436|nr:uncharacterized protein LOC124858597 [Girardinichthys multiradiatus]